MDKIFNPFPTLVEQKAHLESDKSSLEDTKRKVSTRTVELTQNPELVKKADKMEYSNFGKTSLLELIGIARIVKESNTEKAYNFLFETPDRYAKNRIIAVFESYPLETQRILSDAGIFKQDILYLFDRKNLLSLFGGKSNEVLINMYLETKDIGILSILLLERMIEGEDFNKIDFNHITGTEQDKMIQRHRIILQLEYGVSI